MKNYQERLKDPRWQKKRLFILQRDNFECQLCFDAENTLHVHHKYYNNSDPWDAPDSALITLCAECHDQEGAASKPAIDSLKNTIYNAGGMNSAFRLISLAIKDSVKTENLLHLSEWVALSRYIEKLLKSRNDNGDLW